VEQRDDHRDLSTLRFVTNAQALRAVRLLAEIGDVRGRFPTPEALASLAGVSPSTRKSGKSHVVGFRWAVDRQLRDALVEWAGDSRLSSPWAADIYQRARARCHDYPHAVRVLARAWVYVIWRCWQDSVAYDPPVTAVPSAWPASPCRLHERPSVCGRCAGAPFRKRIPGWDASRRAQLSLGDVRRRRADR
jgi:hypothetical protein